MVAPARVRPVVPVCLPPLGHAVSPAPEADGVPRSTPGRRLAVCHRDRPASYGSGHERHRDHSAWQAVPAQMGAARLDTSDPSGPPCRPPHAAIMRTPTDNLGGLPIRGSQPGPGQHVRGKWLRVTGDHGPVRTDPGVDLQAVAAEASWTRSTRRARMSGLVSGRTPWPRLKTWPLSVRPRSRI